MLASVRTCVCAYVLANANTTIATPINEVASQGTGRHEEEQHQCEISEFETGHNGLNKPQNKK